MKWSHKQDQAPVIEPLLTDEQLRAHAGTGKRRRKTKANNANSRAGARPRRAPAKKHTLINKLRALFGKPPLPAGTTRRTRLFTQMLLSFVCLTVVTSSIAGALNFTLVRNYVQDSSMEMLMERAVNIADMMLRPGGSLKVINVQQLDEWERLTNAQVILIDNDLTLITRQTLRNRRLTVTQEMSGEDTPGVGDGTQILSAIDHQLVSLVLSGSKVADVRQFDFMEGTWLFAGAPIMSGGSVDGAVLLCQPLSQIDGVSHNISLIMSLAVTISTLFAIMLSLLLTQRIVQPISAMTRTAQRMANGNYGERVSVPTTTELAQLGDSLNLLSGNLSTTIRSLNQEKVKMELVLSGIGEGILAINQIGKMVHCNDAAVKLLELHDDDATRDVYELTERSPLIGMLIQVLETGEGVGGGWKNGSGQSVAATVSPIRMGDDLVGAVGLVRDVSEAERLEQLRRDYVANISHELRTPLTGIRGMVEPLIDGVYDTEAEKQECYQIIYQETRRLERLISDMLDISRLQDGRIHIELEEMQVQGILVAAARRLERRAAEEGVRLCVEPGEDPVILGNEDRIMQVLIILIDNALKFTPSGGSITLRTRVAEDMLWISVRDTGAGIAKEDLPYIFERFYKADKSRMETRGTGLGLAIARLVVELMGGTIWCESELGRGSSFEFSVKLRDAALNQEQAEAADEAQPADNTAQGRASTSDTGSAPASDSAISAASNGTAPHAEPHSPATSCVPRRINVTEAQPAAAASDGDALMHRRSGGTCADAHAMARHSAPAHEAAPTDKPAEAKPTEAKPESAPSIGQACRAQMREAAASIGVNSDDMEFDELLEMLLDSRRAKSCAHESCDEGAQARGKHSVQPQADGTKDSGEDERAD